VAEQLIAAADRKERAAVFYVIVQIPADLLKTGAYDLLFPVGTSAQKDNISGSKIRMIIQAAFYNLCGDSAPFTPHAHALNVAPVSIEIQEIWVEMYDIQLISGVLHFITAANTHFCNLSRYLCAS
jgi:hypothetical protein